MEPLAIITATASLVTIIAALVAAVSVLTLIKHRTDTMKEVEARLSVDLKEANEKINTLVTLVKVQIAEQAVLNKVTQTTLDALTRRVEEHAELIQQLRAGGAD